MYIYIYRERDAYKRYNGCKANCHIIMKNCHSKQALHHFRLMQCCLH